MYLSSPQPTAQTSWFKIGGHFPQKGEPAGETKRTRLTLIYYWVWCWPWIKRDVLVSVCATLGRAGWILVLYTSEAGDAGRYIVRYSRFLTKLIESYLTSHNKNLTLKRPQLKRVSLAICQPYKIIHADCACRHRRGLARKLLRHIERYTFVASCKSRSLANGSRVVTYFRFPCV